MLGLRIKLCGSLIHAPAFWLGGIFAADEQSVLKVWHMSMVVFVAVIAAAALHAIWNALVKASPDKDLNMTAVVLGHIPVAMLTLLFVPSPDPASYPYIAIGVSLHVGYQYFLLWAYRIGDLTQVYPIARGVAPLIIAIISVTALGVILTLSQGLAIFIIVSGLFSLVLVRQNEGGLNLKAALLAMATGCFIAAYSLVDGYGARAAGTSFGFYGWLAIFNALIFATLMGFFKPGTLQRLPSEGRVAFFVGGSASFVAYAIITWAFTKAPIALVSALRETSIVFALFIGVFVLREKLSLTKLFATFATILGAVMLRFAKS